jgi:hypothetical protein
MTGEQPHADVVAELFWGPEGRQRGRPPASHAGQARPFTR